MRHSVLQIQTGGGAAQATQHAARRLCGTQRLAETLMRAWRWLAARHAARTDNRQLRVVETVQLGEKRFVTLLEVGGERLLIGGAAGQLSLLTHLGNGGGCGSTPGASE